jgi:hypothetical protein
MTEEILINEGKYRFKIVSNQLKNKDGEIYCYSFKIGGNYSDCVNVSISYDSMGKPIYAKIPTLVYDTECSLTSPLDRGKGTITMIKTLLRHINTQIPEINKFIFEDKSNIECGTEEEQRQKRHCKRDPIALYYFSIAFNGITWYEKNFNAYQKDITVHKLYRKRIKDLLENSEMKPSFNEFLRIAQPQTKYLNELQLLYDKSITYGNFFNSMQKDDRCRLVRGWLPTFMGYYLDDVFKNSDWIIDVHKMDNTQNMNQYGGTRKKGQKIKSYYCPIGCIRLLFEQKDIGV